MNNKCFWTLDKDGNEVLRDLFKENETFNREDYLSGKFDANNYQIYEMFSHFIFDDNGCDYERLGCTINEGDVVLDLGGNIGVFAHRAEYRNASKIISFEPITPTFNCLIKNKGPKTDVYKLGVGSKNGFQTFKIHTDFHHIGGGTTNVHNSLVGKEIIHEEIAYVININEIFENFKIDFMKIDIEGGEIELLNTVTDENLKTLRCLSGEFHPYDGLKYFLDIFIRRMNNLGFQQFDLVHSDGLHTVSFWKK